MAARNPSPRTSAMPPLPAPPPPAGPSMPPPVPPDARQPRGKGARGAPPPLPTSRAPEQPSSLTEAMLERAQAQIAEYRTELGRERDNARLCRLHAELARLYERPLFDYAAAEKHYREAIRRRPEHLSARQGLRHVLACQGQHAKVLQHLEAEIELAQDDPTRAALAFQKGLLLETELQRPQAALSAYEEAVAVAPTCTPALEGIARLCRAAGDLKRAERALAQAAHVAPPEEQAALLCAQARVLEVAGDDARATDAYQRAWDTDRDCAVARQSLQRLLLHAGRYETLADVMTAEIEHCSDSARRAVLLTQLAHMQALRLDQPEAALATLAKARTLVPEDPTVLRLAAQLCESLGHETELLAHLEALANVTPDEALRVATLVRMGELCLGSLEDDNGARRWFEAALEVAPLHRKAFRGLEALHTRAGDHNALIRLWTARAAAEASTPARVDWLARAGRLLEERGEHAEAARCYHEALALTPGDRGLQLSLARIYRAAADHEALLSLYRAAVDDPEANIAHKVDMLLQIAQLEEGPARRPGPAIDAYRQVLALSPDHRGAAAALERLSLSEGRFDVLEACLVHQAQHVDGDGRERAELLFRSARVLEKQLKSDERAQARYREALAADDTHLPSLMALERLYRRTGQFGSVLEVGEQQLALLEHADQRAALLLDLADVAGAQLGDATAALGFIQRAKDEAADHPGVRAAHARALEAAGQHRELARLWHAELGAIAEPEARAQAEFRLGQLRELRLDDAETAARCYDAAIGYNPSHQGAWEGLCRTQARLGRDKELADALVRRAEATEDPSLQDQYWLRAAWLYAERLQAPDKARACLRRCAPAVTQPSDRLRLLSDLAARTESDDLAQAASESAAAATRSREGRLRALWELERTARRRNDGEGRQQRLAQLRQIAPTDRAVIDAQFEEAAARRDWAALARLDAELCQLAQAPSEIATATIRQGEALELDHPSDALRSFRRALDADPESLGAARGFARAAERLAQPALLEEAAQHEARTGADAGRMAALEAAAGRLRREQGEPDAAADAFERALSHDPENMEVAEAIVPLLEESGQVLRLLDLLRNTAERAQGAQARRALWLRVGQLQESAVDNVAGALTATQQALRAAPTHRPTLQRLAQLYRRNRQWDEAIKVLQRAVSVSGDEGSLLEVYLDLSTLYEEQLDDAGRAISYLEAAREIDGERSDVAERLARLYGRAGDHQAALQSATALVQRARGPGERAGAYLALARAHAAAGEEGVAEALAEAVRIEGPHGAAGKAFRQHVRTRGDTLANYVQALADFEASADPEPARDAALEVARAHAEVGLDLASAGDHLARALQRDDCPALHLALGQIELRRERAEAALGHADAVVQAEPWRAAGVRLWVDAQLALDQRRRASEGAAVLMVLGSAKDADKALMLEAAETDGHGPVAAAQLDALTESSSVGEAAEALLRALRPAWSKLYPANLDDYGLASQDRLHPEHGLSKLAAALGKRLGVERFELYLNPGRAAEVTVELSDPIKLIIPMATLDLPEGQQRHVLGKPLVAMALGLSPLLKLTARELQILLACACRPVEKTAGAGLTSEDELSQQSRAITRALSRRARKDVEKLARRYMELGAEGMGTWPDERLLGIERAAAKLSDNLPLVVQYWQQRRKALRDLSGARLVEADRGIADAIRLWLSPKCAWQAEPSQ